jgi:hypothetical protein
MAAPSPPHTEPSRAWDASVTATIVSQRRPLPFSTGSAQGDAVAIFAEKIPDTPARRI